MRPSRPLTSSSTILSPRRHHEITSGTAGAVLFCSWPRPLDIPEQGAWLKQVVRGFFAYHAVPTNGSALGAFYYYVKRIWLRTLRRRSQKDSFSWQRMHGLAADWLPQPRILQPYPDKRFAVMHPR